MTPQSKRLYSWKFFRSLLIIGVAVAFSDNYAIAQITPDATLGAESSVVTPNSDIRDLPAELIDGGALRGTNLFHSFQEFNVGEGLRVYFASPVGVENILSRVTGIDPSDIRGTLGVDGIANLFLLNPNGIIFGSNATLDVSGSFIASTANSLVFDNGVEFSTNNPEAPLLLTINVPLGLQYGSNQPGSIVNAGNLAVGSKQNLTLVGGTVTTTGQLSAPGGQVTVAAVPGVSLVLLGQAGEFLSVSPASNLQPTAPDALSLTELLNTIEYDTQLTVTNDTQVELMGLGLQVPVDVGTTIVSGSLNASNLVVGQMGGRVQVLGDKVGLFDFARIDVSGEAGGGTVLIGGDYQGQGALPNATATYVSRDTTIISDAINAGDGGSIVIWANESTRAYGALSARGGAQAGNGGLIETSSRNFLDVSELTVDASAPNGLGGTWLLDPRNVILSYTATSNGTFDGANPNIFTPTGDDAVVFIPDIENQLNLGTNVTIATGSTGTQEGNITADGFGITKTTESPVTLTLQAANNIALSNFGLNSNSGPLNIVLQADSDRSGSGDVVVRNAGIKTRGGQFLATAAGFTLQEAGINSSTSDVGNAGSITVNADTVLIEGLVNGSGIGSTTSGRGNAGAVTVIADSVTLRNRAGISSNAEINSQGDAGQVTVNAGSIFVENNSGFGSDTRGSGNGGEIKLMANSISFINNSGAGSNTYSSGNGGLIKIEAGSVLVANQSGLSTSTSSEGDAGEIRITADSVSVRNFSGINSDTEATGNAGKITIDTGSLLLENNTGVSSRTEVNSQGNAGEIRITADSVVMEKDTGIDSETNGSGDGGIITIDAANSISLRNDSDIFSNTNAQGDAGRVELRASSILFENESGLGSITRGSGDAGEIRITADSLRITGNSGPATNTSGGGNAGKITIDAGSVVLEDNAGVNSRTGVNSQGDAGEIRITADSVVMEKDSEINSSTSGSGNAGQIEITVDSVSLSNSSISTAVNLGAVGQGGAIEIESQSLSLTNQSTLEARSRGEGNAGSIQVNIGDAVTLSNQSQITVSKEGTQGEAGDIEVSAYSLSLDSGSKIIAETDSGEGGDISLLVQDLLVLRDGSRISTEAGTAQAGGDGGNIKIDAQFILAVPEENSDIIANAFEGRGGTINITTQGIFGIEFRANLTPLSDITASSTLGVDGEVEINRPDVDPSRGLAELPTDFVNAQGLIDRSCTPGGSAAQNSSFTVTGRGGLPSNPTDPLSDDTVWSDLRTFTPQAENLLSSATDVDPNKSSTKQIVEAQGWIVNPNGNVILTAKAHPATQQSPWLMSPTCQDVRAVTD